MSYYIAENDDSGSWSGVLVCIVIILIFVMLFRGLRGRQECVVYTGANDNGTAPQVVSYAEEKEPRKGAPAASSPWTPLSAAVGAPYAPLQ